MALVPRALKPKTIVRRTAIRRGGKGGPAVWRALAAYYVGGLKMVRTQSLLRGVLGSNRTWKAIFAGVVLRGQLSRAPEPIAKERLRTGQFLTVRVDKPLSRKQQKRSGITRKVLERQALADVAAAKVADTRS